MARPFKICPDCGAHLDASEPCDRRTADDACSFCPFCDMCRTEPYTWEV